VGASHPHKQQATAKIKALPFTLFFWLEVVPLLIKALPICINEVLFQSPLIYTVPFILQHNPVYAYCKNQINANHEII